MKLTAFKLPFDSYHYIRSLEKEDIVHVDKLGFLEVKHANKEINLNALFDTQVVKKTPSITEGVLSDIVIFIPYDSYTTKYNKEVEPKDVIMEEKELFNKLVPFTRYWITHATDDEFTIYINDKEEYLTLDKKEYRQLWLIKRTHSLQHTHEELFKEMKKKERNDVDYTDTENPTASDEMSENHFINRIRTKRPFLTKEVREKYIDVLEVGDAYLINNKCLVPVKEDWEIDVVAVPSMHQIEIGDVCVYLPFDKEFPETTEGLKRRYGKAINTWTFSWVGFNKELEVLEPEKRYRVIDYTNEHITLADTQFDDELHTIPFFDYVELYLIKNVERLHDFNEHLDPLTDIASGLINTLEGLSTIEEPTTIKSRHGDETFKGYTYLINNEFHMDVSVVLENSNYTSYEDKRKYGHDLGTAFFTAVTKTVSAAGRFGITENDKLHALSLIETWYKKYGYGHRLLKNNK